FYAAAWVPGLALIGNAVFGWWQSPPEPGRESAGSLTPAEARRIWLTPSEPGALVISATPAAPTVATTQRKSAPLPADQDCTDLRALFGLGQRLTDAQKNYLLEHC